MAKLKPGWLERQFKNVDKEVAAWPPSMRREAGFEEEKPMNNAQAPAEATSGFVAPADSPIGGNWTGGLPNEPFVFGQPSRGWPMRTDLPTWQYSGPTVPQRTFLVYLCGPIRGMTIDECRTYFNHAAGLFPSNILAMSPLRFRQFGPIGSIICDSFEDEIMGTQKGIMSRDFFDVARADVVIANFLGAKASSIGSMFELAWCFQVHKPVVLVMEPSGNVHDHPFVREACDFRVTTIEEAVATAVKIVNPGCNHAGL